MSVASGLRALGFPARNTDFVDSLARVEALTGIHFDSDSSSDMELSGDEWVGVRLLSRGEAQQKREGSERVSRSDKMVVDNEEAMPRVEQEVVVDSVAPHQLQPMEGLRNATSTRYDGPTSMDGVQSLGGAAGSVAQAGTRIGSSLSSTKRKKPSSSVSEIEVSSESDMEILEMHPPRPSTSSVPTAPAPPKALSPARKTTPPKKGRGKGKPRKSLEAECADISKIRDQAKLRERFDTISSLVDHLNGFEREGKKAATLSGLRIMFVNPLKPFNPLEVQPRNANTLDLRMMIPLVRQHAATLVKPEDFVPAPAGASLSAEWDAKAAEGGWTTLIIPLETRYAAPPTFADTLACIGPSGVSVEELGPYVRFVKFDWLADFLERKTPYLRPYEGDTRFATIPALARSPPKTKTRKRTRMSRKNQDDYVTDEEDDEEHDEDGVHRGGSDGERPVSPFGPEDVPARFKPLPAMFPFDPPVPQSTSSPRNSTGNLTSSSDPIVDPPPTAKQVIPGLEDELQQVHDLGCDTVDMALSMAQDDDQRRTPTTVDLDLLILGNVPEDDFETDEEKDRLERKYAAASDHKKGKKGKKDHDPTSPSKKGGYICEVSSKGHDSKRVSPNEHTAKVLDELSRLALDEWRERGYTNAARSLRRQTVLIDTLIKAKDIKGIGDSIGSKIVEIVRTGTHRKVTQASPRTQAEAKFQGIYGVGQAIASELYDRGARTLNDLRDDSRFNLTRVQQLGVQHYDDLQHRIPRSEVEEFYRIAKAQAYAIDPKLIVECMGSFRRGQPDCGDIDLLVTRDTKDGGDHSGAVRKLWEALTKVQMARHTLSEPGEDWNALDAKVNGLCALPQGKMRRIDILGVPWTQMPATLVYFTGNDYFNRSMRLKARKMGFSLNQRGLYKHVLRGKGGAKQTEGVLVEGIKTEEDIFKLLNVPYRPPDERLP